MRSTPTTTSQDPSNDDLAFISCPTPQLRRMIAQYRAAFGRDQFAALLRAVEKTFTEYSAALAKKPKGAARARATHQLIEMAFATSSGIKPSCAAGCASCCHLEVEITEDEAALLAERVHTGLAVNREKLATQAARARQSTAWEPLLQASNRCVFLGGDDRCRVYEDRPSICRKHVVSSPASECSSLDGAPSAIPIPLAEIALSAALSQKDHSYGSLSKMVEAALFAADSTPESAAARSRELPPNVTEIVKLLLPERVSRTMNAAGKATERTTADGTAQKGEPPLVMIRSKTSGEPLRASLQKPSARARRSTA